MSNELEATAEQTSMIALIEKCVLDTNVSVDKLEKMLDLQERLMAKQALIDFNSAFAEMQPKFPPIPAKGKGHNNVRYPLKEDMNMLCNPILSEYGFSLSFSNTQKDGFIKTIATLTHRGGHSISTEIVLKDDNSGSKNAVQAVGSSQTYGERYAMKSLLNLTILKDPTDDDGQSSYMDSEELILIKKTISKSQNVAELTKARNEALSNVSRMSKQQQLEIRAEVERVRKMIGGNNG